MQNDVTTWSVAQSNRVPKDSDNKADSVTTIHRNSSCELFSCTRLRNCDSKGGRFAVPVLVVRSRSKIFFPPDVHRDRWVLLYKHTWTFLSCLLPITGKRSISVPVWVVVCLNFRVCLPVYQNCLYISVAFPKSITDYETLIKHPW